MTDPKFLNETRLVIGPCRLCYVHLLEKYSHEGEDGKYSCTVLIPKSEKNTVEAIQKAMEAAKKNGVTSKWNGKEPRKIKWALGDGDEKDDETFHDHYYLNAKTNDRPGVVDRKKVPIVDAEDVYSGMWAMVSVSFFPYSFSGNNGVGCLLNNVMKWKDDDRLGGGRASAESDFGDIDGEDDDEL